MKKIGSISEMAQKLQAKVSKVWECFTEIKQLGMDSLKLTKQLAFHCSTIMMRQHLKQQ